MYSDSPTQESPPINEAQADYTPLQLAHQSPEQQIKHLVNMLVMWVPAGHEPRAKQIAKDIQAMAGEVKEGVTRQLNESLAKVSELHRQIEVHLREKEDASRRANRLRTQLQKFQLSFTKLREDHQKLKMSIKDEIAKVGEENLKQGQEVVMKVFSTCLESSKAIESLNRQDEDRAKAKVQLE